MWIMLKYKKAVLKNQNKTHKNKKDTIHNVKNAQ